MTNQAAVKVKRRKHYTPGAIAWIFVKYVSLIFFAFVAVLPIVSCVITAFKTDAEYKATNVMTLPDSWLNFDNFIKAFQKANMIFNRCFSLWFARRWWKYDCIIKSFQI